MTTPDTICFGTLFKTGGKGHTVKNQKLRWCVLQGTFLTYYYETPDLSVKAFDKLKGQLYLEGCQIRDADATERENSFIITSGNGKEYIFTPTVGKEECTMWKNAIMYALKKVKIFAEQLAGEPLAAGWLMKKGGKGHKTQNWKKRYFILQGQFLNYFDRANARPDDLTGLKGWINLTEITELSNDEDAEDGCEKPHYLKIITTNEKGYFLVARNDEEKKQWFFRLKRQLDLFVKTYELPQTNLVIEEKEVKSGFLMRSSGSEWRKTWVVLTNVNIRFYKGDTRKNPTDLGKQLFETIRLVGISLEEVKGKTKDPVVKLVDVLGNAYMLSIVEAEFKTWVDAIKRTASSLVTTIINKGESINMNCRTSPDDANDKTKRQEYTQVKLTRDTLSFFFLLSNARVDIPLKNIDKVSDAGGVFYLKYQLNDKPQELRVKSSNVQGLYSTINTVLEIYREKNRPSFGEPMRPSEQEEFSFENTYLSDSFFEKMERDVEAEAGATNVANAAVETVGEAAVQVNLDALFKSGSKPVFEMPKPVDPKKFTAAKNVEPQPQKPIVEVPKPEPPKQIVEPQPIVEVSKPVDPQPPKPTVEIPKQQIVEPQQPIVDVPMPIEPQLQQNPTVDVPMPVNEVPKPVEPQLQRPPIVEMPKPVEPPKQIVEPQQPIVDVSKPVDPSIQMRPAKVSKPLPPQPRKQTVDVKPIPPIPKQEVKIPATDPTPQTKPVDSPPQPRPIFVAALPKYMKPDESKAKTKPAQAPRWVTGRMPVEEKLPPPSLKDLPTEGSAPKPIVPQDIFVIPAVVTPMSTSPEVLEQQAQELLLVKTHEKSSEHLSLASEMNIDISNLRLSFVNGTLPGPKSPRTNSNPIHKAGMDYSFRNSEGDSDVYGISDRDLHDIVGAEGSDIFRKIGAVYQPNPASLEPTITTDLSDSECSSMTNSFVFKPDEPTSTGSIQASPRKPQEPTNNTNERLVVIKAVSLPHRNILQSSGGTSAAQSSPRDQSPSRRDSGTSSSSSRRYSADYDTFYSSITYDTLTPVGSVTNDALAHMDKNKSSSKTSLEAQIALQSIEKFLDTKPTIGSVAPDTIITPRVNVEEKEEPRPDVNLYESLDNLLKETEDLLRQTLQE